MWPAKLNVRSPNNIFVAPGIVRQLSNGGGKEIFICKRNLTGWKGKKP